MSATKTKLEQVLEVYANLKDGQFELSHNKDDKWRVTIVQLWKDGYERMIALGVGGTAEDACAAALDDYYERIDSEMI